MKYGASRFSASGFRRTLTSLILTTLMVLCAAEWSSAQDSGVERSFPQSKATVEKALKEMQSATAGRLPVLEGFATSADHPLPRYQRGYYQSKFQVKAAPSGGSVVQVSVQVTAWYADPVASRSGYQMLTSNGRLEADLLDQLSDQLAGRAPPESPQVDASSPTSAARKPFPSEKSAVAPSLPEHPPSRQSSPEESPSTAPKRTADANEPSISAPVPQLPESGGGFPSSLTQGLAEQEKTVAQAGQKKPADENTSALRAEAESLEEILKNQSHPKNLVAVKKSGTPVVATASLTAKALFLASAHDEFEMLDFNRDWVHVRISGLSRGWIWRNSLEMPDSVPYSDAPASPTPGSVAAELFHVTREEQAPFPGDWPPLRGKRVQIVSVEKINETGKDTGPQLRLEFAKSVLDRDYAELAQKSQELAGIVLIFDSVDGGMIATTFATLQQWKAGKMSDAALWHQCFFDPPEIFSESGVSASQ
jgi:hypothetical protein